MVRSSLDAGAAHGSALVTAAQGVAFQWRAQDGALTSHKAGPLAAAPEWVRVLRVGTTVTAYASADGTTWSAIGSSTIALGSVAYVGLAVTSHNTAAATTALLSQVSVVPLALPAPQEAADIGAPALPGWASYRTGVYTHHAAGADISGSSDQFNFIYQPVTGDVEVIARVRSIGARNSRAKSGVMIREDLTPRSRNAFALATAGRGFWFQRRIDPGGFTQRTTGPSSAPPGWVRLVRTRLPFRGVLLGGRCGLDVDGIRHGADG